MKVKGDDDDDDGVMGKVPDKGRGSSEREREKIVGKAQREKVAPDFHLNKDSRMH